MNNLPEETMWSFVIRIWLEDIMEDGQIVWRGHITHVSSNQRRHFDDLENMQQFVKSFLEKANGT